jgi:hypothetical protein
MLGKMTWGKGCRAIVLAMLALLLPVDALAAAPAGKTVRVKLKLPKRALKAIARALERHKKVSANLTITAKDAGGNKKTEKRPVELR